jgi:hypothetical protein
MASYVLLLPCKDMEENMASTIRDAAATAGDFGRDVKDSIAEFGRSASGKIDTAREQTSDALRGAAASVRQGSAKLDVLAGSAASRLDAAATAVKDTDLQSLGAGLRRFGQRHLTGIVLGAIAVGYLAGSVVNKPRN